MAGLRHSSSALGKHLLLGALAYQLAWRVLYCAALLAPSQVIRAAAPNLPPCPYLPSVWL